MRGIKEEIWYNPIDDEIGCLISSRNLASFICFSNDTQAGYEGPWAHHHIMADLESEFWEFIGFV